jgi:hypothetical protein
VLIAVVLAIVAVEAFDLVDEGVAVVGSLPQGFPPLTIPDVSLTDIGQLVPGALGIALVALVDTISTASVFAERAGDRIRGDQEMVGIGSSNVAAGLFQGFPVSNQRLAHGRRGAGGGQDPGGRPRRRDRDHPDPPAGTRPSCGACRSRRSPPWSSRRRCPS